MVFMNFIFCLCFLFFLSVKGFKIWNEVIAEQDIVHYRWFVREGNTLTHLLKVEGLVSQGILVHKGISGLLGISDFEWCPCVFMYVCVREPG